MKITVIYHPVGEHARAVDEYIHEFSVRYPDFSVEMLSVESRAGAELASLYDIVDYPAIMVTDGTGRVAKVWQGAQLPIMDEIAYYAMA